MNASTRALLVFAPLLAALLAGCIGGGDDDGDGDPVGPVVREFDLEVGAAMMPLYPIGRDAQGNEIHAMTAVIGFHHVDGVQDPQVPGPELRVTEGDLVIVNFINNDNLGFNHTIHWHGVHVPWDMDGTPYVSQAPVRVGTSFQYEFVATPSGTMWYHCHVDASHHVDLGMYGALIVEPRDTSREPAFDREVTLFLDEWDKNHIHSANLSHSAQPEASGDPVALAERIITQARDAPYATEEGREATEGRTRVQRDWWPDTPPPYFPDYNTFTINSRAFPWTAPIMVAEGETLRIRMIPVGGMVHSMHIHGHTFEVTHKDGRLLPAPYGADTLLMGPGERYDVLLHANNPGVWEFHDHISGMTSNDGIWPGGMMTMVVYEGFDATTGGHVGHGSFGSGPRGELVSGDFVHAHRRH